jgi:predicted ArsR family transcriptional regulator
MLVTGNIRSVERLPVFKALGDNTRYAIFLELARSPEPLSTAEVAEALDLHPNTVRPHLERMRDVGLLEVDSDSRGAVGRPQHRYWLAPEAPSLGLEPSAFRLLARLVAGVAARSGLPPDEVAEVGRDHGRAAAEERIRAGRPPVASGESAGGSTAPGPRCVSALAAELADLGFDPAVAEDGAATTIAFTHCPFRELAEAFPEVVCHLHRGIVEGFVGEVGGAAVTRFATLEDRSPCEVDLIAG